MFSYISTNWSGKPLRSFDTILSCIRGACTDIALKIESFMLEGHYKKGKKVPDEEMEKLKMKHWS